MNKKDTPDPPGPVRVMYDAGQSVTTADEELKGSFVWVTDERSGKPVTFKGNIKRFGPNSVFVFGLNGQESAALTDERQEKEFPLGNAQVVIRVMAD